MSSPKYPNESSDYRAARDALLEAEIDLIRRVKAVAEQRRQLPDGGKLKEDYVFISANDDSLGQPVRFSELFEDKPTLLLYSYMFGPNWDHPCPSCTSLIDGFDRAAISVTQHAAFVVVAKATPEQLNAWARQREWRHIRLVSAHDSEYLRDYRCQNDDTDKTLQPIMNVFKKSNGAICHFWGSEMNGNHVDMIWPYWNLMDMTPEGRPDRLTPPQNFRSRFLEEHYLANLSS